MDGKKFSEAYQQPATGRYHPDHERASLMAPAYEWSDRFSEIIHGIIRQEPLDEKQGQAILQGYLRWSASDLPAITQEVVENADITTDTHNLNTLNFHFVNSQMYPIWMHVLAGAQTIPRDTVHAVQNNLAAYGVDLLSYKTKILENENYQDVEITYPWRFNNGILNEIDTLITMLELTASHPNLAVLAAPGMFESSHDSSKNSDVLVIDLQSPQRETHGVQTKMFINSTTREKVDPAYVTLIDGSIDLDSTKVIRANHHSSKMVVAPWPGQVAVHHLIAMKKAIGLDTHTKRRMLANAKRQGKANSQIQSMAITTRLLQAKSEAYRLATKESKSQNRKVAARVIERVMNDFYK